MERNKLAWVKVINSDDTKPFIVVKSLDGDIRQYKNSNKLPKYVLKFIANKEKEIFINDAYVTVYIYRR